MDIVKVINDECDSASRLNVLTYRTNFYHKAVSTQGVPFNFFRTLLLVILCSLQLQLSLFATERLAHIFNDNMVLQRNVAVPIWGWAKKGQTVKVMFGSQKKIAIATTNGKWMVHLDPMPANNNSQDLKVVGATTRTVKNVLVGEVWICSGQSNMSMPFKTALNTKEERNAARYPGLRMVTIRNDERSLPQPDTVSSCSWVICSPISVVDFSAVGYYFGRELLNQLKVPIGLINNSWGGTAIEPWICPEGFRLVPELTGFSQEVDDCLPTTDIGQKRYLEYFKQLKTWLSNAETTVKAKRMIPIPPVEPWIIGRQMPTKNYNAMVHPLIPYAIRGVIWYQGESNASEGDTYLQKMKALIGGWRQLWGKDFPFYFVQLANFSVKADPNNPAMGGDCWGTIREAQLKSLSIPYTGMAVTIDIGEENNVHFRNKLDVGKRLALWALAKDYQKPIVYSGPLYKSQKVEGDKIRIIFDSAESGLMIAVKKGLAPPKEVVDGKVKWISISGKNKRFFWADTVIEGSTLLVFSKKVPQPVVVRYAFATNPYGANLYNKDGLPASPFRTDNDEHFVPNPDNLFNDGDFELQPQASCVNVTGNKEQNDAVHLYKGNPAPKDNFHKGQYCLGLDLKSKRTVFSFVKPSGVRVDQTKTYRLSISFFIPSKTSLLCTGYASNRRGEQLKDKTGGVWSYGIKITGPTVGWQKVEITIAPEDSSSNSFTWPKGTEKIGMNVYMWGEKGTAYLDDITVKKITDEDSITK